MDDLLKDVSDEDLVGKILATGDSSLYGEVYERYSKRVFNKCLSFVSEPEAAKDLAHDIFLKIYMNLGSFKGRSKFSTWVYSITYNFCVDFIKSRGQEWDRLKTYARDIQNESVDSEVNEQELLSVKVEALKAALKVLDPDEKIILLMKYQDEMTISELSDHFGIGVSAAKMRLARTRNKVVSICNQDDVRNYEK